MDNYQRLTGVEQIEGLGEDNPGHKDLKDMLNTLLQFV
jgi:beta-catenin-like protein 1